ELRSKTADIQGLDTSVKNVIKVIEEKLIQYLTSVERNSIEFMFHYKWYRYEISIRLIDGIGDPEHISNTNRRLLIVISKRDVTNHIMLGTEEYHDLRSIPKPPILTRIIDKSIEYIKKHVKELEKERKELEIKYENLGELNQKLSDDLEDLEGISKRGGFLSRIGKKKEYNEEADKN
ncbi:MAG: hypothetical protein R3321_02725, partial [Nitrososphaeraceae archaeon]|nr:hypothetical protein [Nitrososphaeraceae archaeon]